MKTTPTDAFKVLYRQIKGCQTEESEISAKLAECVWNDLRVITLEPTDCPSKAIMAALLLSREEFRSLITDVEYMQLERTTLEAVSHYLKIINPINPVGRKLADAIKEERET